MSESHVHVTVGFPFSEILIGHLVCLSSFAVCLLTSTLGISGQASSGVSVLTVLREVCGVTAVRLKVRAMVTDPDGGFLYLEGFAANT